MKIEFEGYLQDQFFEEEPMTLDDDFPDGFNDWLETKDVSDILEYAEEYDKKIKADRIKWLESIMPDVNHIAWNECIKTILINANK